MRTLPPASSFARVEASRLDGSDHARSLQPRASVGQVSLGGSAGEVPLEVRDLCVDLAGERILSHVTFRIEAGELVGVSGPNGGGKSTLLRAILGLAPKSHGEVRIFGESEPRLRNHALIGYVPQNAAHVDANFPATAYEVARLGTTSPRGPHRLRSFLRGAAEKDRVLTAMRSVGVDGLAKRRIGTLSGGQRQRVLLAKALASQPDLILLDEPTTGIDPQARADFAELLLHLNQTVGMTILLVSHDDDVLRRAADRVLTIDRRLCSDSSADEGSSIAPPESFSRSVRP